MKTTAKNLRTSYLLLFMGCFISTVCFAQPLKVVVSIPDFGWMAKKIGGNEVAVKYLLKGTENPHYVDAVPSYIQAVASADVVCFAGFGLELGWLPKVLTRSGNAKVQPGGIGFCELGTVISPLELPQGQVNRSMGDIHPQGNPHYWLSPLRLAKAGEKMFDVFVGLRPDKSALFSANLKNLTEELNALHAKLKAKLAAALAKQTAPYMIQYHRDFSYFANDYGLNNFGSIEEKPGVLPSAGRIARISLSARKNGVRFAMASTYDPKKLLRRFEEISKIPVLVVPISTQPQGAWPDYPNLQTHLIDTLVKTLKK